MEKVHEHVITAGQGVAFELYREMRLRVTDPRGLQMVALTAFHLNDTTCQLSLSKSRGSASANRVPGSDAPDGLVVGDALISSAGAELLRITADTLAVPGASGMHVGLCNRAASEAMGHGATAGCFEALYQAAEPWGLDVPEIGTPGAGPDLALDLFARPADDRDGVAAAMESDNYIIVDKEGRSGNFRDSAGDPGDWQVLGESISVPGDYMEFEALTDCLVACSNCPYETEGEVKFEFFE